MKSIIITGASGEIGSALAKCVAADYDYIAICGCKNTDALNTLAASINQTGHCACKSFAGDMGNFDFAASVIHTVAADAGRIDALINNAAISETGLLTDMSPAAWHNIMSTNVDSVYNTCHEAVPYMVRQKSGTIINISSVWGLVGASCEVAYSATKGAVNSFSKALAKELAPSGISVNAIALGVVDTKMNSHLTTEEKAQLAEEIPYGKMAAPEEAAIFIKNILSMPSYFTGEVVKFDGGWI
ncbi:MAG: SDR family NAD(P)-dependent oxidoreductase [Clostridium sp.]|nr:SDR family NAD(P)-dependent oxidoreductase [Clostridium sp.]MCM1399208.1 SDR family NAD(P)-dependent oxidoreductase [Clostridium sp.]MCM1459230.1 SDR family NAD(P)-dependent oxidoreductase [Bacteroides sp.]